jgi:hypothetical protein
VREQIDVWLRVSLSAPAEHDRERQHDTAYKLASQSLYDREGWDYHVERIEDAGFVAEAEIRDDVPRSIIVTARERETLRGALALLRSAGNLYEAVGAAALIDKLGEGEG